MKKIFISIFAISLIFCMFSCSDAKYKNIDFYGGGVAPEGVTVDRPNITIESYSEYKKFIRSANIPEDFIYYEDIEVLGEFESFVCEIYSGKYSEYYSLHDDNLGEFYLYIEKEPFQETEHTKSVITDVDKFDMRFLDAETSGTYQYKNIRYVFLVGKLHSIKWKSGEWYYTISSIDDLKEDTSKANISKLFNLETAPDLIASVAKPEEIK
jgi:hypothetical protein